MNADAIAYVGGGAILITIIVNIIKMAVTLPSNIVPLIAVALAVAYACGMKQWEPGDVLITVSWFATVIAGIFLGASSVGLYEIIAKNGGATAPSMFGGD